MPPPFQSFETERLWLKPTNKADAPFIFELLNSPKWLRYIGNRYIHSINDAKVYIHQHVVPQFERLGYGNYVIVRKNDGAKVGACGLYDRDGLEGIDIGFALLPDFERKGYAFEAANCLKIAAFEVFKLNEIVAITTKNNIASQKLLDKLGLQFKGYVYLPNDQEQLLLYKLAASNQLA